MKWFRLSADQEYAEAQFNLGVTYAGGRGVRQDYAEAVKWFRLAADKGIAEAQYNLGIEYAEGRGVPRDSVSAYMWLTLSAARASDLKLRDLGLKFREDVEKDLTAAQIAEAQRRVVQWQPKTANATSRM